MPDLALKVLGQIKHGQLPVAELQSTLQVGRSALRFALARLIQDGLVEVITPRRAGMSAPGMLVRLHPSLAPPPSDEPDIPACLRK